ncbi:MAG: hypothetical protein ACYSWW_20570, partial [Planctomycetota bacterium]
MNRREVLYSIAGGLAAAAVGDWGTVYGAGQAKRKRLGIAQFSYNIRLRAERSSRVKGRLSEPMYFLDHCHRIGAGGVQMDIGVRNRMYTRKLCEKAQSYDMFIEG